MKCIYKDCNEEAIMTMTITRDETAVLGDGSAVLTIFKNDDKTPYCPKHLCIIYERFRNFFFIAYEAIEK